ncbi:GIY-YIG nuclease family protein [Streptomyces scabiei]|uniref:GIY-YIG nuclease family protein n=1 Tax=Streptomyces scabiei TaxID=1930 RepID=UPI0029B83B59|nr:GIY-YIG nuclease family protein [Streptomyces scabiei]MDX3520761.1 GIY-YIG nuclease family protein [Streptomyces scabiei]
MPPHDMTERTAVYRLRDRKGRLLYVGISNDPEFRWRQHQSVKPWWSDVSAKEVTWYDTRALALQAEAEAIHAEQPLYNSIIPRLGKVVPEPLTRTAQPSQEALAIKAAAERRARLEEEFKAADNELRELLVQGRAKGMGPAEMARLTGFTPGWVATVAPDPKRRRFAS